MSTLSRPRRSSRTALFKSVSHLRNGCSTLADRCVAGAHTEHLRASVANSIGIVTALNPYIGYAHATAVAQEAHASGGSVYDIVLARKLLTKQQQLDQILRPETLTRPVPLNLAPPADGGAQH